MSEQLGYSWFRLSLNLGSVLQFPTGKSGGRARTLSSGNNEGGTAALGAPRPLDMAALSPPGELKSFTADGNLAQKCQH